MSNNIKFFQWIASICKLMEQPASYGESLIKDPCWFYCFDDGMSPEEALQEARNNNIVKDNALVNTN